MRFCAAILFATATAMAQKSASVKGVTVDAIHAGLPSTVRLIPVDDPKQERSFATDYSGAFVFERVTPGLYVLSAKAPGFRQTLRVMQIGPGGLNIGELLLPIAPGCNSGYRDC